MPRASLLLASLLGLGLIAPQFAQESNQNQQNQNQRQQSQQNQQQQQQNQQQAQQQQQNQQGQEQQGQQQKLVDASLSEGQTLKIPAGGELLELTVAVPKSVHTGQRYRYRARITNISDSATLANVQLVQINGDQVDIEKAQFVGNQQSQSSQGNQQQQANQQQNQRQQQNQQQQNQQANRQQSQEPQQSTQGPNRSWRLGQLKPGQSRELAVTAVASQTGQLEHCFAVRYEEVLCAPLEVVKPKVAITKTGPEQASVCEVFQYRYTLENTGTGVAKNFIVRDDLPEGLLTESGKNELAFRIPELAEGESKSFVANVHSMKAGEYSSRAIVEQASGETRQSKRITTRVIAPKLDLQIEGPRTIKAGEGGNFDVTVTNTSQVPAQNVVLTLDPGENAQVSNAGNGDAREGGQSYRYNLGDLNADQSKSVSLTLDSNQQGNVKLNATAQAVCAREQGENITVAEAEAAMQSRVLRITSLLLSVVDTDDVIPTGEAVTYRIRVRNQGSFPDQNVKVNLKLPNGLTFQEAKGPTQAQANGQSVSLGTVKEISPGETLEWHVTTQAKSPGEHIVEGTLDSQALQSTVEAQEVSTIYDASKQRTRGEATASEEDEETRRE